MGDLQLRGREYCNVVTKTKKVFGLVAGSKPPGRPYPPAEEGARKERKGLAMLDVGGCGLPGGSQGEEGLARELLGDIRSGNPPLIYAPPGGR